MWGAVAVREARRHLRSRVLGGRRVGDGGPTRRRRTGSATSMVLVSRDKAGRTHTRETRALYRYTTELPFPLRSGGPIRAADTPPNLSSLSGMRIVRYAALIRNEAK